MMDSHTGYDTGRMCGKKRQRRCLHVGNLGLMTAACCVISASVVTAFQPAMNNHSNKRGGSPPLRPMKSSQSRVVTDPDTLLLETMSNTYNRRNADIEIMYRMSADESDQFYPHSELEWESWLQETSDSRTVGGGTVDSSKTKKEKKSAQPVQLKGLTTTARQRTVPRRNLATAPPRIKLSSTVTAKKAKPISKITTATATTTIISTENLTSRRRSRSSTMPGFAAMSDKQRAHLAGIRLAERRSGRKIVETPAAAVERRKANGHAMYHTSASVPDSLVQFGDEIHREERITPQEEVALGEQTQEAIRLQNTYELLKAQLQREPSDEEWCAAAGKINMEAIRQAIEDGFEAKNKLVTANLRLVQSVVNTYIRNGLSAQYNAGDMMQEGILALIRAAEKFEPDRGWKFSTYAMYWVRASVKRSQLYQSRILTVPQRLQEKHKRLLLIEADLRVELGRTPTRKEMGKVVGMTELQVDRCFSAMEQRSLSLDQELQNKKKRSYNDNDKGTLIELISSGDHELTDRVFLLEALVEAMHRHLTPEEVEILLLRFGLKEGPSPENKYRNKQLTIAELGEIVGHKPDKVRRMIDKSLKRLKESGEEEWREFQQALL